jgi:large subunit ribosomal protein L10
MPRPEKVQAVAEIKDRLERARAVFLAEYAGLSVKDQQTLRRGLRAGGAEFKIVKMTLARRAAAELDISELDELFLGPTGIAFAEGDPVTAAKALKDFAKDNEALVIKGGMLGGEFLSPERISALAEIESRDVLLSKLAGLFKAPMTNLAGLFAALPRNMASALQQLAEKKEEAGGGEPPAAEDAATETAEEETGDAVAAEESAEDAAAAPEESAEKKEAVEASQDSAEEAGADDDSDGDDAKSVDEDPAEEAEEE